MCDSDRVWRVTLPTGWPVAMLPGWRVAVYVGPFHPLLGRCVGCASAAVGPTQGGWGRSSRLLCGHLGNATLPGCRVGGEHQSWAGEAVVLGTPPPPGPPLPRAPALALQHPHSAQFRASCVGSGFVRVFFPLECSKTRQRLRKPHRNWPAALARGAALVPRANRAHRSHFNHRIATLQVREGAASALQTLASQLGYWLSFPSLLGSRLPLGRRASLRGYESPGCSSLVAF